MLAAASRLALSGLVLSLVAAAPAMAQSQPSGTEPARACYRTIADRGDDAATSRPADSLCIAPRERIIHGGWLGRAIMMIGDADRAVGEPPRPASSWRDAEPRFTVPPVYR